MKRPPPRFLVAASLALLGVYGQLQQGLALEQPEEAEKAAPKATKEEPETKAPPEEIGPLDTTRFKASVRSVPFEDGSGPGRVVWIIDIDGVIDLGLAPFVERVVEEATEQGNVAAIVSEIDTPGGRVDAAIAIKDALLESKILTLAWVHTQAISAGALIAYAHDHILFANGGTMGAATPIQLGASGESQEVGEKVVSFMRGVMRATAEAKDRDGEVAEAMVDRSIRISGISTSDKLLTLTHKQALEWGVADGAANDLDGVLAYLKLQGATVERRHTNWAEDIARFLTEPTLSSLLISVGMLGLVIELYTPGFGFAGALGISALGLFFFGHSVVHLAGVEEILLLLLGLVLVGLEIFVIPGFGVAGVAGICCVLASLVLMMLGLPVSVSWETGSLADALGRVSLSFVGTVLLAIVAFRVLPRTARGKQLVLHATLPSPDVAHSPVDSAPAGEAVGTIGVATADLRPVGKARLGEVYVDVISEGEYIPRGTAVQVVRNDGGKLVVRAHKAAE
jgi:membrane-bound serine protease (ClpP class)